MKTVFIAFDAIISIQTERIMRTIFRNIALFICLLIGCFNGYAQHRPTEAFGKGFRLHYRGFAQADHAFFFHHEHAGVAELMTSHGVQIFPQLFVGLGSGVNLIYNQNGATLRLPIFLHVRSELLNRRYSPYIDTKIGYMGEHITTLTQSVGYHVYFGSSKMGLSLGVGYNLLVQTSEDGTQSANGLNVHLILDF